MFFWGGYAGNKKDNVTVIYTPWTNLHKNAGMAVGQVGFHEQKKVSLYLLSSERVSVDSTSRSHQKPPPNPTSQMKPSPPPPVSEADFCPLHRGFSKTKHVLVPTRLNATINRLNKTRTVADPASLATDKEAHLKVLRGEANQQRQAERKEEERLRKEQREEKWKRDHAYEELHAGLESGEVGRSNADGFDEDDFM